MLKTILNNLKKVKQKDLKLITPAIVALVVFTGSLMGFEIDAMSLEQKISTGISGAALIIGIFMNMDKK